MARILVTGSSGLIGSGVAARLSELGYTVETLDKVGEADWSGDLTDKNFTQSVDWSRFEGVIHFAAVSRVVVAQSDPLLTWKTNVEASVQILQNLIRMETVPWFLFASSREVYGQSSTLPVQENAPMQPLNYYGYAKAILELYLEAIQDKRLKWQIIRFSNVYGGLNDHLDRVIPKFLELAYRGEKLQLEGGSNTFDFTYLSDVVHGLCLVVERFVANQPLPRRLQIVTGVPTTLRHLARTIELVVNRRVKEQEVKGRDFDVSSFYGSTTLLEQTLEWKPQTHLLEGLKKYHRELHSSAVAKSVNFL